MAERVTWRGVQLDPRTRDMMEELAAISGDIIIQPSQGSWSGAAASAGTHTGGGAVDLMNNTPAQMDTIVDLSRKIGFAGWHRTPAQSDWPHHVHLIAVQKGGKPDRGCLAQGAHNQVVDYYDGFNGLASRGRDDATRAYVGVTWEKYQEDDMPLSSEDIEKIAKAVWRQQIEMSKDSGADSRRADWLLKKAADKQP